MSIQPELLTIDTIQAAQSAQNASLTSYPIRFWRYGKPSSESAPEQTTIVLIHGRRSELPDRSKGIDEIFPNFDALAQQLIHPSVQVLFLDWGEAAFDAQLPPYSAAGRVQAVAEWAVQFLRSQAPGQPITLVGHSLGSYLGAEIGQQLRDSTDLVALDPALPGQRYDLDTVEPQQQTVKNFDEVDTQSLAFVVADDWLQTGLAGDNNQAGAAQYSFVVQFDGLFGVFDATDAHNAVIEVYQDWSGFVTPNVPLQDQLLDRFPKNQYDNFGNRRRGSHEGIVRVNREAEHWEITQLDGEGRDIYLVRREGENPSDRDGGVDTVLSQVSVTLDSSLEELVLVGQAHINGRGNAADNWLHGNNGRNDLSGDRGNDVLLGNGGADVLVGGDGIDQLWGGTGRNLLIGNAGVDYVGLERGLGQAIVQDFVDGEDKLLLGDGLQFVELAILSDATRTTIQSGNDLLATLIGVEDNQISAADFVMNVL